MFSGVDSFEQPENPKDRQEFRQKLRKVRNEINNPCVKEHDMVFKCLDKNNYDYEKCNDYFENYKGCKNFWGRLRSERRAKGIIPNLPPPEEREKIRAEYVASKKTGV
ncbi:hypothetical protein L9F63_022945 [Diploptera punctata]|uniref:Coiled-coil-helix-coiled-coil-helix domain-containing protein 7 n=1 Tax=Diploptera punctata TaxID=6984 RepID=A0AAD8EAI1_DIPPU|nr:hypothetical protein L9F63_022945 [Diploptera punctata]